jgi:ketosteroid isomerase-like protein
LKEEIFLRIQTSEMLATSDAETVLRVLEWSLREISIEVVRNGRRITLRGLGPSQRTMNRNDVAVVEVVNENHHTVIRADITYQASALLGGTSQDDLVRSKLDRVLEHVKTELGTQSVRVEAVSWFATEGLGPEYIEPELALEQEHAVEAEHKPEAGTKTGGEPKQSVEPVHEAKAVVAIEPVHETKAVVAIEPVHETEPLVANEPVSKMAPEIVTEPIREREPEVVVDRGASVPLPVASEVVAVKAAVEKSTTAAGPISSERRVEIPMFQAFHSEETKTPKRWGLLATVVCMLAAVGLFVAWPYLVGLVHERIYPSSGVAEGNVAGETPETAASEDRKPIATSDADAVAARNAAIHNESDPKVWLESWADAMRGQDAGAQALFYADPVDRYALKSNVSNADVWLDKKNAIQNRPKVWTFTLEDVAIEPRPDESLRVRLTKHYTTAQSEGGQVSEQFIHSQLKLKKIDGQWKITSEQNLRP